MSGNYNNYDEQIDPSFDRGQTTFGNVKIEDVVGRDNNSLTLPSIPVPTVTLPTIQASNIPPNGIANNLDDVNSMGNTSSAYRKTVSSTKRAAQNRSAQKAFRKRRERYIKDIEAQAAEVPALKQTIEELRAENVRLRDYTIALQGKLIEVGSTDGFTQPDHNGYVSKQQ